MAAKDIDALTGLLTLPPGQPDMAGSAASAPITSAGIRTRLEALSNDGRASAHAVLSLADAVGAHLSAIEGSATDIYAQAVAAFDAGDIPGAVGKLGGLLASEQAVADDTALALAICAARLDRYEEALPLAQESLKSGIRHPRAYCIVGMCELLRGNKAAAQENLAMATRMGRNHPEFREDMRLAQRLLLIRHFG